MREFERSGSAKRANSQRFVGRDSGQSTQFEDVPDGDAIDGEAPARIIGIVEPTVFKTCSAPRDAQAILDQRAPLKPVNCVPGGRRIELSSVWSRLTLGFDGILDETPMPGVEGRRLPDRSLVELPQPCTPAASSARRTAGNPWSLNTFVDCREPECAQPGRIKFNGTIRAVQRLEHDSKSGMHIHGALPPRRLRLEGVHGIGQIQAPKVGIQAPASVVELRRLRVRSMQEDAFFPCSVRSICVNAQQAVSNEPEEDSQMTSKTSVEVPELNPADAWNELAANPDSALVDVRTRPEWAFVGVADLSEINRKMALAEWRAFPDMRVNALFLDELKARLGRKLPGHLYFMCRSGTRSRDAAQYVAAVTSEEGRPVRCVNVAEGFEGDLDASGHRASVNGWKVRGLSWRQS